MNRGKRTCKILKEIRQQIAEKNDIEYITSECHFQGECKGTCPKCEAEVSYLERELQKRQQLGKAVVLAGISLGMVGSFAACNSPKQKEDTQSISIQKEDTVTDDVKGMIFKSNPLDTIPLPPPIVPFYFHPDPPLQGQVEIDTFNHPVNPPKEAIVEDTVNWDSFPMGIMVSALIEDVKLNPPTNENLQSAPNK